MLIQKFVINKVIELLSKNFKLFKLMKYVEEPNELDHKVVELENQILKLEKDSHPPIFSKKDKDGIIKRLKKVEEHIERLDDIAHPPFFSSEEKANMLDRIKQLESIDYDMHLRNKDE